MAVSEATLLAKISALEARVTKLAAKVKTDETTLTALAPLVSRVSFLAALTQMTPPPGYPVTLEGVPMGFGGPYWQSGERDAISAWATAINSIVTKLVGNGYM